jgi:hypothetical protein
MAKHVFSNMEECAHAWAHQTVDYGNAGNVSFKGADFYSYSTVVARRLVHNDTPVFVINSERFSSSTCKHQSAALRAAFGVVVYHNFEHYRQPCYAAWGYMTGSSMTVTSVYEVRDLLWVDYQRSSEHSRYKHVRADRYIQKQRLLGRIITFCRQVDIEYEEMSAEQERCVGEYAEQSRIYDEWRKKKDERNERNERRLQEKIERNKEEFERRRAELIALAEGDLTQIEDLSVFGYGVRAHPFNCFYGNKLFAGREDLEEKIVAEAGRRSKLKAEDWLKGEHVVLPYDHEILLRVCKDGRIETSRHASIPYGEGEKCFRFVIARRNKGWERNGERFRVGDFQLDAVTENGITAGCHFIGWDEIIRFAKQEGWIE